MYMHSYSFGGRITNRKKRLKTNFKQMKRNNNQRRRKAVWRKWRAQEPSCYLQNKLWFVAILFFFIPISLRVHAGCFCALVFPFGWLLKYFAFLSFVSQFFAILCFFLELLFYVLMLVMGGTLKLAKTEKKRTENGV